MKTKKVKKKVIDKKKVVKLKVKAIKTPTKVKIKVVKKPNKTKETKLKILIKPITKIGKKLANQIYSDAPVDRKLLKKALEQETPIHDADYWINRPLDDNHLDWDYPGNWIEGYWQSFEHPHRKLVLGSLVDLEPFDSLLELGCNCGPNLNLIRMNYRDIRLAGLDIDPRVIELAKDKLRDVEFQVGSIVKLPWNTQSFDAVLADAVLMYLNPDDLKLALDEIERVARKAVVIVDRFDESMTGIRNGDVWAYNHQKLLENRGFKVKGIKITKQDWPNSIGWAKYGYVWIGTK